MEIKPHLQSLSGLKPFGLITGLASQYGSMVDHIEKLKQAYEVKGLSDIDISLHIGWLFNSLKLYDELKERNLNVGNIDLTYPDWNQKIFRRDLDKAAEFEDTRTSKLVRKVMEIAYRLTTSNSIELSTQHLQEGIAIFRDMKQRNSDEYFFRTDSGIVNEPIFFKEVIDQILQLRKLGHNAFLTIEINAFNHTYAEYLNFIRECQKYLDFYEKPIILASIDFAHMYEAMAKDGHTIVDSMEIIEKLLKDDKRSYGIGSFEINSAEEKPDGIVVPHSDGNHVPFFLAQKDLLKTARKSQLGLTIDPITNKPSPLHLILEPSHKDLEQIQQAMKGDFNLES